MRRLLAWALLLAAACGGAGGDAPPLDRTWFADDFVGQAASGVDALSDGLRGRQAAGTVQGVRWTRVAGGGEGLPAPSDAQLGALGLTFRRRPSAARLELPIPPDRADARRLSTRVAFPRPGGRATLALSSRPGFGGDAAAPDALLAVAVASDGTFEVRVEGAIAARGAWSAPADAVPLRVAAARDPVTGAARAVGTVAGAWFSAPMPRAPGALFAALGAELQGDAEVAFRDLAVGPASALRHYGYDWTVSAEFGDHLAEVGAFTDLGYAHEPRDLAACARAGAHCLFGIDRAFFCEAEDGTATLCPDRAERWAALLRDPEFAEGRPAIRAFYLVDEPDLKAISTPMLEEAAAAVTATFPDVPLFFPYAPSGVHAAMDIPRGVPWVGFDHYAPMTEVAPRLALMAAKLDAAGSPQRLVLMPQAFPGWLPCAPGGCDAALEALQHEYLLLGLLEPRVVGLVNWGTWVTPDAPSLAALPLTTRLQRWIGREVAGVGSPSDRRLDR